MPTIREALTAAARRLRQAGIELAPQEAAWLLAHALGTSVGQLHLRAAAPLPAAAAAAFAELVARREQRMPVQYILGTQEFMGLTFRVTPAVLIPRADTEVLVQAVAAAVRAAFPAAPALELADIGTGSGCIAVGLCHLLPAARVAAVDIAAAALAVAAENARRLGAGDRVTFHQGDLYAPLAGRRFHAIASNPPYIAAGELADLQPEVRLHEPHAALTPGPDGLAIIRRLVAGAREHLLPGGLLGLEVGHDQAEATLALMQEHGLHPQAHRDDLGHLRCILGAYC